MRRFLPLLIGVIVTPISTAARHETMLAYVVDEGETNLPVSRGMVDTGSTEQIYLMLKELQKKDKRHRKGLEEKTKRETELDFRTLL